MWPGGGGSFALRAVEHVRELSDDVGKGSHAPVVAGPASRNAVFEGAVGAVPRFRVVAVRGRADQGVRVGVGKRVERGVVCRADRASESFLVFRGVFAGEGKLGCDA